MVKSEKFLQNWFLNLKKKKKGNFNTKKGKIFFFIFGYTLIEGKIFKHWTKERGCLWLKMGELTCLKLLVLVGPISSSYSAVQPLFDINFITCE